jgi:hypothetical protein
VCVSLEPQLVRGMLTPGHTGPVVHACRFRARVPSRVLDGLEWDAHVQQRRDERVAEAVGVDAVDLVIAAADQPGGLGELTEQAVDGLAVERHARRLVTRADTATVLAAEDRALRPRADSPQHGALGALVEGHIDLLAALAADHQRMTAAGLASQVLDIRSATAYDSPWTMHKRWRRSIASAGVA